MNGRKVGRAAYFVLLSSTTLGTLSSTVMSAPVNEIAADLDAGPQAIVLAVSAFTIAMVIFAPFAGWLSDRLGPVDFLVMSMVLMSLAQLGAALAPNLAFLVAMRAVQGIACSAIPPAVQMGLATFWPDRRARSMGAWAAAIGIGQAIGPPAGGVVAELFGWRATFGGQAGVCLVLTLLLARFVPRLPRRPTRLNGSAMTQLVAGGGLLISGLTWFGQSVGTDAGLPALLVAATGVAVLAVALRPGRRGGHLLGPGSDRTYVAATVAAACGMAVMGITLVGVPLFLGREVGLSPGVIGATTFAVALGMAGFAPVAGRMAPRMGTGRVLVIGLLVLLVAPMGLWWLETEHPTPGVVLPLTAVLFVIGCGISTVQSMSALLLVRDGTARTGLALGVHNMGRFSGLAVGYAWVAGLYALGTPALVPLGAAIAAGLSLVLVIGPVRVPARRLVAAEPGPP